MNKYLKGSHIREKETHIEKEKKGKKKTKKKKELIHRRKLSRN